MPLYRCVNTNCPDAVPHYDFEAPLPVCPKCGADARKNSQLIVPRAEIHYLVNDPAGPIVTPHGNRRIACDPKAKRLPKHATGESICVTCPKCVASQVVAKHVADNVDQDLKIIPLTKNK